jgi:ADP-dependent phosphofructokinase/glucokinase
MKKEESQRDVNDHIQQSNIQNKIVNNFRKMFNFLVINIVEMANVKNMQISRELI